MSGDTDPAFDAEPPYYDYAVIFTSRRTPGDEASIARGRRDAEYRLAQAAERERWYADYRLRVARVGRAYGFTAGK
ncbi:MAG: hypothetical protein QM690_13025 [Sphingobium sp.]